MFFSSDWFFFIYFNSLFNFSCCSSVLVPNSMSTFIFLPWILCLVECLFPFHWVFLWDFCSFSFQHNENCFLDLPNSLFTSLYLVVLPSLEEWTYVEDFLCCLAPCSSLATRAKCFRDVLYVGCLYLSVVMEPAMTEVLICRRRS